MRRNLIEVIEQEFENSGCIWLLMGIDDAVKLPVSYKIYTRLN